MVDIFIPCFIDQLFPDTGWNVVKVLKKAGITSNYNPSQTCCGQPHYNSGYWNHSRKMAEKFLTDFSHDRPIIVPSASCAGFIINHYPKLFKDQPEELEKFQLIKKNVVEFTDFLVNHLKISEFGTSFHHTVTYHDGCAALREYGIEKEPRELLKNVEGLQLNEMEDRDVCCGFGGTFMVKFASISTAMVQQKIEHALNTNAEYIVSSEASCLININSYIEKNNVPLKTIHIADVLASF